MMRTVVYSDGQKFHDPGRIEWTDSVQLQLGSVRQPLRSPVQNGLNQPTSTVWLHIAEFRVVFWNKETSLPGGLLAHSWYLPATTKREGIKQRLWPSITKSWPNPRETAINYNEKRRSNEN